MTLLSSKWVDGVLKFFNTTTGDTVLSLDPAGDVELGTNQFLKNSVFTVTYPQVAAADAAKTFFIAPAACEFIAASERHVTVAGQAAGLTIEKLTAGEAPGAGDVLLAAAFDLLSTANTTVTKTAVTTGVQTLAAGDALCLKVASGNVASYALGTITATLKWL